MSEKRRDTPRPQNEPALSADAETSIYRNVMDTVASGVMSLDAHGNIILFNAMATKITGLPQESVVGRPFAEIFPQMKEVDEFTDVVLDAVYDVSVGSQRVIEATFLGHKYSLSMQTSYLREERDGKTVRIGVVAIFNDISEIKDLREKEFQLAKEVEAKHAELQEAYRTLEDGNQKLRAMLKRGKYIRAGEAVFVLAIFLALVWYNWGPAPHPDMPDGVRIQDVEADAENLSTFVVEPQRITSTVTVAGHLAPQQEVGVTSPINGKVIDLYFQYGERVAKGQKLVALDISEVEIEYRGAQVNHIKALERVQELEDWGSHVDVSRARREVSQARISLETRKNRLDETIFLLERGIIPSSEHEAAQREYNSQKLALQAAEQDLEIVLARGTKDRRVAQLELDNAQARLSALEEIMRKAVVHAPVSGVALHPNSPKGKTASDEQSPGLTRGAFVNHGDHLLTIGDLDGLAVVGQVDEVDVVKVRPGNPAKIVGEAFPDIGLSGEITRVSSQASQGSDSGGVPKFKVIAVVENLTGEQREFLRLGMSAHLEVVVYDRMGALLVPIDAVEIRDGESFLRVMDRDSGSIRSVSVATGVTTLDTVEIVSGIEAGSEVVIPVL